MSAKAMSCQIDDLFFSMKFWLDLEILKHNHQTWKRPRSHFYACLLVPQSCLQYYFCKLQQTWKYSSFSVLRGTQYQTGRDCKQPVLTLNLSLLWLDPMCFRDPFPSELPHSSLQTPLQTSWRCHRSDWQYSLRLTSTLCTGA